MDSYAISVEIDAAPEAVYEALTSGITGWWTTAADDASIVGSEFVTRFGETFNRIHVESLEPNREVRWVVIEQHHASEQLTRHDEWAGTKIIWQIEPADDNQSTLSFVHEGLVPELECWEICEAGWDRFLLHSLKSYAETGEGQPFQHQ